MPEISDRFRSRVEAFGRCPRSELYQTSQGVLADVSEELVRALLTWYEWFASPQADEGSRTHGQEYVERTGTDATYEQIKLALEQTFIQIRDPVAVPAFIEAIEPSRKDYVREVAMLALGKIEDPRVVPALAKLLHDDSPEMRGKAAWTLREVGGPEALAAIEAMPPELRTGSTDYAATLMKGSQGRASRAMQRAANDLHIACYQGDIERARQALAQGADVDGRDIAGHPPLLVAVQRGHLAIVKLLLDSGANPNATDGKMPAIHTAVVYERRDIAELLLSKGADPNAPTSSGLTAYQLASSSHDQQIGRLLMKAGGFVHAASTEQKVVSPEQATRKAVEDAIAQLSARDVQSRINAMRHLREMGPDAKPAVPILIRLLEAEPWQVRANAAKALGGIGPDAEPAIALLTPKVLDSKENSSVRIAAGEALGEIGPQALPTLQRLMRNEDADVRYFAVRGVGTAGPDAELAVPDLLLLIDRFHFDDRNDKAPWEAVEALGKIGPAAKAAVPPLLELVQDRNQYVGVRSEAAAALVEIGPEPSVAVPVLSKFLEELLDRRSLRTGFRGPPVSLLQNRVVFALSKLGPEAIPILIATYQRDHAPREAIIDALGNGGPEAALALTEILQLIAERGMAEDMGPILGELGKMGPKASVALPKLRKLLESPDANRIDRDAIAKLIERLGP